MVIYRFPPGSGKGDDSEKGSDNQAGKAPDFIYVDEKAHQEKREGRSHSESPFSRSPLGKGTYPFFLRALTLLIAGVLSCLVIVLLVAFLAAGALATILLFQSPEAIQLATRLWNSVGRFSAYALALYVATLSPAFGFGILTLYALQHGGDAKASPFSRIFKGRFEGL